MIKRFYKISELNNTDEVKKQDLVEVSSNGTSGSVDFSQIADLAVKNTEYDSLTTSEKTIIGAINEAAQSHIEVQVNQVRTSGTEIATIKVNNNEVVPIYSQGIEVNTQDTATRTLQSLEVNGVNYKVHSGIDKPIIYGFHINSSESDPSACVTYLEDAIGMTPAKMDFTNKVFNYGSWGDNFIINGIKPCILNPQGQVVCYLNPNDYTKDIDGNTVPITQAEMDADSTSPYYMGNVMVEFPKIYMKMVPDEGDPTSASIYFSNKEIDYSYKDYAYISPSKEHKEHFYMAAYNGSVVGDTYSASAVMRSVSGSRAMNRITASESRTMCVNNGSNYHMITLSEVTLINLLLVLFGKSLNSQAVYGQGLTSGGSESINDNFRTGEQNQRGLFYGMNSGTITSSDFTNCVKVFGIENWWGFAWRRYDGHVLKSGVHYIKNCFGQEDGSTADGFSDSGTGYINTDISSPTNGYIAKETFISDTMIASATGSPATSSKCYCDYYYTGTNTFAYRGGPSGSGAYCGSFSVDLSNSASGRHWNIGSSPSCT